jgi:mannose-6-phosphate isomerase-like protein (cupin superfamily)
METWIPFRSKVFVETTDQICGEAMKLVLVSTTTALAIPCYALAESNAEVFSGTDVKSQLALSSRQRKLRAAAELHSNITKHAVKLSVRTATRGTEIHAHDDDIFVVTEGKATLVHLGDSGKC